MEVKWLMFSCKKRQHLMQRLVPREAFRLMTKYFYWLLFCCITHQEISCKLKNPTGLAGKTPWGGNR
jgi:hypothetical protein